MRNNYQLYSEEMKEWLRNNISDTRYSSYQELAIAFNIMFGTHVSGSKLSDLCGKRMKLSRGFNSTSYKKGHQLHLLPIGTIRKCSNGCTYIKVKDNESVQYRGYAEPFWVPIQKYIYEQAYGKIPEGTMVIFLDCNRDNLALDNLKVIDRQTSVYLAKRLLYSKDAEITKTGILCYELQNKIKEIN